MMDIPPQAQQPPQTAIEAGIIARNIEQVIRQITDYQERYDFALDEKCVINLCRAKVLAEDMRAHIFMLHRRLGG